MWFALACAVLLVVPLVDRATASSPGCAYLLALAVGLLGNVVLRGGCLSWLPWAASFALYPAFLSYGGWGGAGATATRRSCSMTVLAALLGVGVHVLRALPGLVADNEDGLRPPAAAARRCAPAPPGCWWLGLAVCTAPGRGRRWLSAGTHVGLAQ